MNFVTESHKLTRRILLKQDDWPDWRESEFKQLDQYAQQFLFGDPCLPSNKNAVFFLIWTYTVKMEDGRKKARLTCDGSSRGGAVRVLDFTFANSVDQTGSRIFYAIAAAENLYVFGSDAANAFAEAPPPKQGFYVRPDDAFREWWKARGKPDIPKGHVIPVLAAMQGHPESPRLWEKHINKILIKRLGFTHTIHEPCLYSGNVAGNRVLIKRQVDDFAVATIDNDTATTVFDNIDSHLRLKMRRQGLIHMYNGLDIKQSRWYIKIYIATWLKRILLPYLETWLEVPSSTHPTPLGSKVAFLKELYSTAGDPDPKVIAALEKKHKVKYRKLLGEGIWPASTCRIDIAQAIIKCAQASAAPADVHFLALKSIFRYLAATTDHGIYFWRSKPLMDLPDDPLPEIQSTPHDLLMANRPSDQLGIMDGYMDTSWGDCLLTRRSFAGTILRMAGGPIWWKARIQPTVAGSSTEAEFMNYSDSGHACLYARSILWDLGVPQEAATIMYGDNDAATAMANAGKVTPRARHIDIKY